MRRRAVALALSTALTALGAFAAPAQAAGPERCADPTADRDFRERAAAEANLDPAALQQLLDFATTRNSASMRVYRHGCLIGSSRLDAATENAPWWWFSTGKGVTALVVGRALQLGKLSLDDQVSKYFPEADEAHGRIRLRDLITQSGGLRFSMSGDFVNAASTDTVRFALQQEVVHPPGTFFEYQQHGLTLLLACVQRAVGEDVQTFADRELFSKLGIDRNEWFWIRDRAGWSNGYGGVFSSPRLMPRLAHLLLNEGVWNGKRLLSASFVRAARSATPTNGGYGYLLWTNQGDSYVTSSIPGRQVVNRPLVPSAPRDLYFFVGIGGQYLYMIPSLDLVIERVGMHPSRGKDGLFTEGSRGDGEFNWELFRLLDKVVTDASWQDPGPYQQLDLQPFEPSYVVEPEGTVAGLGVGERAGGCNVVACDGKPDFTGYEQMQQDFTRFSIKALTTIPRP
ncbi:MAG: serine hydrolase domain-containing protein [Sporichthyaceae bacterium]